MDKPSRLPDLGPTWEPSRVIINNTGEALPPARAYKEHGIGASVAFLRTDGFSLGAPVALEDAAHGMWSDEWVAFARRPWESWRPMSLYGKLDVRSEFLALLEGLGCTWTEGSGITKVTTPDSQTWDYTVPMMTDQ